MRTVCNAFIMNILGASVAVWALTALPAYGEASEAPSAPVTAPSQGGAEMDGPAAAPEELVTDDTPAAPEAPAAAEAPEGPLARLRQLERTDDIYWPRPGVHHPDHSREGPDTAHGILRQMGRSRDAGTRASALRELGRAAPANLEVLAKGLGASKPEVRRAAVDALVALPADSAFEVVMWVLSRGTSLQIASVDAALPRLREPLEGRMLELLKSPREPEFRKVPAAYSLGRMGSTAATGLLTELAWSGEPMLSVYSANALATLADAQATPNLVDLLRHRDFAVQLEAVHGLAKTGGPQAQAALTEVVLGRIEAPVPVRERAVLVLGVLGGPSVVPVLVEAMQKDYQIREEAGATLRRLTGVDLMDEPMAWAHWLSEVRAADAAARRPPPLVPSLPPDPEMQKLIEDARKEVAGEAP